MWGTPTTLVLPNSRTSLANSMKVFRDRVDIGTLKRLTTPWVVDGGSGDGGLAPAAPVLGGGMMVEVWAGGAWGVPLRYLTSNRSALAPEASVLITRMSDARV